MSLYDDFKKETEKSGYYLNPDVDFVENLLKSIKENEKRYGYGACPCRLASGERSKDLDLICPCDYRDADLNDFGYCFCALYVTKEVIDKNLKIKPIPDRRIKELSKKESEPQENKGIAKLKYPLWRCKVCGYLCCRNEAPEKCPICNVDKDRFERIL